MSIHDVSFLRHPEFAENRNRRYLETTIPRTAANADAIVTISRFSATEITALLGVDPSRIHVTYLAVAPHMKPAPREDVIRLKKSLGLSRPYLLSVGTLEPRKNIPFLVDVIERLPDHDLVLAGAPGWKVEPILERIRRSPAASRIRHVSYVPDADLPALYTGADLFLFASYYEGFGFPPLEAMSCGTPVISSPGGSLREVLGDGALILKPEDPDHWSESAKELFSDPERRQAGIQAGFAQAARYSWEQTAQQTWDIYRQAARS